MLLKVSLLLPEVAPFLVHSLGKYSASSIVLVLLSDPSVAVLWRLLQLPEPLVVWLPQRRVVHCPEEIVVKGLGAYNNCVHTFAILALKIEISPSLVKRVSSASRSLRCSSA